MVINGALNPINPKQWGPFSPSSHYWNCLCVGGGVGLGRVRRSYRVQGYIFQFRLGLRV